MCIRDRYWFVTITPYGPEIEPHVPPKAQVLQDFITLSKIVGPDCIAWRYDPIFLTDTYTAVRHIAEFEQMAAVLSGYTKTCVISFIDLYEKVRRNFPQVKSVPHTERETLGKAFVEIGKKYGMMIRPVSYTHLDVYKRQYIAIPTYIIWLVLFFREVHFDNHKAFEKYLLK